MVIIKSRHISYFCFCLFLLFFNINVHADSNKGYKEVSSDKIWIVKFNKEIDFNKFNVMEIELKNSKGCLIDCNVLKGDKSNEIKVLPPEGGYNFNEKYTLSINKESYPQLKEESSVNFIIPNQAFLNEPEWDNSLILNFNEQEYIVTNKITSNIDSQIGTAIYNGVLGNVYELYSIKGIGSYSKIAIKTKNGYLIAIAV